MLKISQIIKIKLGKSIPFEKLHNMDFCHIKKEGGTSKTEKEFFLKNSFYSFKEENEK